MSVNLIKFIRARFKVENNFIPLHEPKFYGKEKEYLLDAIDSTFVSSVGTYVDRFEIMMSQISQTKKSSSISKWNFSLTSSLAFSRS
jgi:perosamine synthetase